MRVADVREQSKKGNEASIGFGLKVVGSAENFDPCPKKYVLLIFLWGRCLLQASGDDIFQYWYRCLGSLSCLVVDCRVAFHLNTTADADTNHLSHRPPTLLRYHDRCEEGSEEGSSPAAHEEGTPGNHEESHEEGHEETAKSVKAMKATKKDNLAVRDMILAEDFTQLYLEYGLVVARIHEHGCEAIQQGAHVEVRW